MPKCFTDLLGRWKSQLE